MIAEIGSAPSTIRAIKVVGKMTSKDWTFVKNYMPALEEFDISGTDIKTIPEEAFLDHQRITVIHLPSTVTSIGNRAFRNCPQLTIVNGCENVKEIGCEVFGYCYKLSQFPFGNAIQSIEYNAFENCSSLPATLVLSASLTSLGSNVFYGSSVTSFDLSQCTMTNGISSNPFGQCTSLLLPEKGDYSLSCYALNESHLTELRLPSVVNGLSCENVLPATLERLYVSRTEPIWVDNNAFRYVDFDNCTLYVPVGCKDAYEVASGWSNFDNVQEQGIKVNITGLGSVMLGNISYSNGGVFFANQGGATTLKLVPDYDNEWQTVKLNGNALGIADDGTFTIPAGTTLGTLDISFTNNLPTINNPNGGELKDKIAEISNNPSTIRGIKVVGTMKPKDWTFVKDNMSALEEFDISKTDLKAIPEEALQNHQKLTIMHLPTTVTSIGNWAFTNCPQLTTVDGCENVKGIGCYAFESCQKLSVFPFGNAIQSIEYNAFYYCSSLPATLVFSASLNSLGSNVFYGSSVTSFDLSQCTYTGSIDNNVFGECTSLVLPEKGDYSLSCNALKDAPLTELRLPSVVNGLSCENVLPATLERLYVSRTEPIWVDNNAFRYVDFDNCTLYVPVGSKEVYSEASGWSNFVNVQEQGIKVNISGFGSVVQGNISYSNGDVFFANQGSATTLKLVPDYDNEWQTVKLNGNALSIAEDGTFTIPAGTTLGTLDILFTSNMLTIDNPNGGELKDKVAATGITPSTIRAIKVIGKMAAKDWTFVKNNMTALEEFDISGTDLKVIPESALQEHQNITIVHLPSTVTTIERSAFNNCPKLTTIDGCEQVKEIQDGAFNYCIKLANFPFGNELQSLSECFWGCISLPEELVLPTSVYSIGWANTFRESSIRKFDLSQCHLTQSISQWIFGQATSVLLPEYGSYGVDLRTFEGSNITELTFPACVTYIGEYVVPSSMERIYAKNATPINADSKAFNYVDPNVCVLYVPIGSKSLYETATGWSVFTNIKEYGMTVVVGEEGKVHTDGHTLMGTTTFFPKGNTATFEIVPNAGWHADAVTLNGANIAFANNKFTLSGDQLNGNLAVSFAINQFKLELQIAGNGKVKVGSQEYSTNQILTVDSLTTLNLTLEPAQGQMVSAITFNGQESVVQNGGKTYVTPAIVTNSTLAITFGTSGAIGNVVTYTVNTGEGGTVEYKNTTLLSPQTTILVPKGQDAVFEMKPNQYYVVDAVKLNNQDVTGELDSNGKLTVKNTTADAKLEVTFRINAEITVVMEEGGTLANILTNALKQKVTKLIVKGPIWEQDFYTMRDEMPLLAEIDLWEAQTEYIPYKAFCTTDDWWGTSLGKRSLTSVRLPEHTHRIGGFAFAGCSNLKEVNFTELKQLEYLEGRTFAQTSLSVVDLSKTQLTDLGGEFYQMKKLENIKLPKTLTRLSDAFRESTLTEIDLSDYTNLKTLESTFNQCRDLVKVTLPEGLTSINDAFSGCEKLTTINLPKSLQAIGASAFSNTKLQKIDLSGLTELQSIGGSAFSSCYELSEILFPTSLEQIGDNAFSSCNKLTSVDLSNTQLQRISEWAFAWCNGLENVKMPKTLETIGNYAFENCNKLVGNLELESGITRIGDNAFAGTQISIIRSKATVPPVLSNNSMPETWVAAFVPEGSADDYKEAVVWKDKWILDKEVPAEVTVTKEGNLAIDIINQIGIPQATITHLKVHGPLGQKDFASMRSNMTLLYDLDMFDAEVTVIPEKAFLDKKVLMNVKLPASLRTIESYAFKGCSALDGSLTLPDGLRLIGWSAFQGCSSLDEVVFNESLEAIQGYAFEGCSSLKQEITLPRDFQSLGEHAFANCSSLYGTVKFNRDFYMFMGTEGYGSSTGYCFENCSNIETVDMSEPDFLDEIPYYTFVNCTSLKTVLLPQNLDRIDNGAFYNCTSLDNIEFPNTLLVINGDAFQNCTSLSSLNLSDCNNMGTIEGHAFENCSNLETVYLPKSLNWIGEYAFRNCRNLANLTVEAVQPADLGDYVFDKVRTDRCILSIPTGTYYDYASAEQWGAFVQTRKSIDVTVGDGANLFIVNDEPNAARGARRTSAAEQQGAKVKDGSSLYVQENETAVFKVNPDENVEIAKVLFNGKDVTNEMVNGVYETPGVTAASSFEVQVNVLGDLHVKELRMLDDNVTMMVAEKRQLKFAVYPTNATNQTITWTSSNEKVATVNSDGIITGVAAGSVEITGKTIDGGLEKKCQVVIKPNKYWLVSEEKVEEDIERGVRLPLALHNEDEARAIQFDVWTPENMSMEEWNIELSGRASGYQLQTERISNKVIRVKVSSPTGGKFKNSDGELLTLSFYTGSKGGDYDVAIRNVHITGPNNFDFTAPDHIIRFSMPSYPMGDSNGDGKVTINDAVNTIDYILGRGCERFFWNLTNVNKDGDISVADITGIIDIVLERKSHASAARKTANNAQGRLYMNDISMTAGKQQTIGLQMENAADFIAFQCDIYLPTGMEIAYDKNGNALVSLAGGVTSHHTISANLLDNGALRVIVMSPQNERLSILENDIVNLSVTTESTMVGDGVIDIRDIRLVRSSDHSECMAPNASAYVHFGEPTAIDKLMASKGLKMKMEDHYLIIDAETATTLPLVSTNGISRELQIHKGENRFFIENTGVYIIGGNKLIVK
ncbi:MAG: leucine-rich repeat protein [Prevotella sp.]|nr:leucine-rich repeat protein [Prevotella sp.]